MTKRCFVFAAVAMAIVAGTIQGCGEPKPESFQIALIAAKSHAKSSTFSSADARKLEGYVAEAGISAVERENRYDAVAKAMLESGNVKWLIEFKHFRVDGALGEIQTDVVWHFVSAHTTTFFEQVDQKQDFTSELNNPHLGFGRKEEVRLCLKNITSYIAAAKDEKKRRFAQECATSLEDLLKEFPDRPIKVGTENVIPRADGRPIFDS